MRALLLRARLLLIVVLAFLLVSCWPVGPVYYDTMPVGTPERIEVPGGIR